MTFSDLAEILFLRPATPPIAARYRRRTGQPSSLSLLS